MSQKYYKISQGGGAFWDLSQPKKENQELAPGQVKPLKLTEFTSKRLKAGFLEEAKEEEFKEYQTSLKVSKVSKSSSEEDVEGLKATLAESVSAGKELLEKNEELNKSNQALSDSKKTIEDQLKASKDELDKEKKLVASLQDQLAKKGNAK